MSHSSKKKKKVLKSDRNEFIPATIKESSLETYNKSQNDSDFSLNEYSLFNKKNIKIILNSENELITQKNIPYLSTCISSPMECHSMPLIMINSHKNTVSSQCPANGQSNELTNPHEPDDVTEMPVNEYLKKINDFYNNIKCFNCPKKYNVNSKDNFYLCYNCNQYLCNNCKDKHVKLNNNNESQMNEKHYVLDIDSLSCYCLYHNEKNFGYCHNCKQNICYKCTKNKIHISHDIVLLKNILINNKEVN